jgi:hypothetical protein
MSEKLSVSGEIWSDSSLKKRSLSEQYPIKEGEPKEEYEERLGLIDLYSEDEDDADNSSTVEIAEDLDEPSKEYIFRKLGKLATGYLFDLKERDPDTYQSEQTSDNMRKRGIFYLKQFEKLQPDSNFIKKNKGYFLKNIPNEMAPNGHINTASDFLNGKKRTDGNGYIFKDDVSRAKEKENVIKESREKWSSEQKETDFWSRVAEVYMYQFVSSYGLFDSPTGLRAHPIFPSKVDDLLHGVDCAFNIPVETEEGDAVYIPISLDLTTATTKRDDSSGKFSKFRDWAGGQTTLHYALEQTEREDGEGGELKIFKPQKLPNFVVGVSRESIKKLIAPNPTSGKSLRPNEVYKESIYRQIYQQCVLRMKYYEQFLNSNDRELKTEAENMKLLMEYFDKMSNNGSGEAISESEQLVIKWTQNAIEKNPF